MNFSFLANPNVIALLLHSAAVAVEKASPDYTVAHHIAATFDSLLGNKPISTPNAKAATPVGAAIAGGVLSATVGLAGGQ